MHAPANFIPAVHSEEGKLTKHALNVRVKICQTLAGLGRKPVFILKWKNEDDRANVRNSDAWIYIRS